MIKEVTLTVESPVDCTEEQFKEWAEYELGFRHDIALDNPLCDFDFEASSVVINEI